MSAARPRRSRVNAALTPERPYRETADVVTATSRLIRAVGKRVAEEDPADLAHLLRLSQDVDDAWADAIEGLRRSGYSDAAIGEALGVTRQAVHQRWARGDEGD